MSDWFANYRQQWIADALDVYGFVNREHLQRKFGISVPQASIDLQRFLRAHPGDVQYDLSRKCYVRVDRH
jgi:hypothetical protein